MRSCASSSSPCEDSERCRSECSSFTSASMWLEICSSAMSPILSPERRDPPLPADLAQLQRVARRLFALRGRADVGGRGVAAHCDLPDRDPGLLDLPQALGQRDLARQARLLDLLEQLRRQQLLAQLVVVL